MQTFEFKGQEMKTHEKYLVSEITKWEKDNNVKEIGLNRLKKGDIVLIEIGDRTTFQGIGLEYGFNEFTFVGSSKFTAVFKSTKDKKTIIFDIQANPNMRFYKGNNFYKRKNK